jgi:hypothetical protein
MTFPTPNEAQSFLMGNSVPGAKFDAPGTGVGGPITEPPSMQQQRDFTTGELKVWNDGQPQRQLVVTVQTQLRDPEITEDDGKRRFYVKGELKKAVAAAVRAAGATALEVGGVLTVTYTGDGVSAGRGMNAPKLYSATYVKPVAGAAAQAGFLGDGFTPDTAAPLGTGIFPHVPAGPARPANVPEGVWATLTPEAKAAMGALAKA